jgi:hypothetical protein
MLFEFEIQIHEIVQRCFSPLRFFCRGIVTPTKNCSMVSSLVACSLRSFCVSRRSEGCVKMVFVIKFNYSTKCPSTKLTSSKSLSTKCPVDYLSVDKIDIEQKSVDQVSGGLFVRRPNIRRPTVRRPTVRQPTVRPLTIMKKSKPMCIHSYKKITILKLLVGLKIVNSFFLQDNFSTVLRAVTAFKFKQN